MRQSKRVWKNLNRFDIRNLFRCFKSTQMRKRHFRFNFHRIFLTFSLHFHYIFNSSCHCRNLFHFSFQFHSVFLVTLPPSTPLLLPRLPYHHNILLIIYALTRWVNWLLRTALKISSRIPSNGQESSSGWSHQSTKDYAIVQEESPSKCSSQAKVELRNRRFRRRHV